MITEKRYPLFLVLLAASVFIFMLMPKKSFWVRDSGNKFLLISQNNDIAIAEKSSNIIRYPAQNIDNKGVFFPITKPFAYKTKDGFRSQYPLNIYLHLNRMLFKIFGYTGLYLLSFISFIFICMILFYSLPPLSRRDRFFFITALFLSTPLLFYSLTFWEHLPALLLGTCGFIFHKKQNSFHNFFTAALCFSIASLLREEYLLFTLSVIITSSCDNFKKNSAKNLFIVIFISLFLIFFADISARIKHFTINSEFTINIYQILISRLHVINNLLFSNHHNISISFTRSIITIALIILIIVKKREQKVILIVYSLIVLSYLRDLFLTREAYHFLLHSNGLFFTFPLSIFLFISNNRTLYLQKILFTFILLVLIFCPQVSSFGLHWSARMLLPVIPLIIILIHNMLNGAYSQKRILYLILSVSVIIQLFSIFLLYDRKTQTAALITRIANTPDLPIITTVPWLAEDLAPLYHQRNIFLLKNPAAIDELKDLLRSHKINKVIFIYFSKDYILKNDVISGVFNRFRLLNLGVDELIIG